MWWNVVFGVWYNLHTSTTIFATETTTKEKKGKLKLQHLYQLGSDMQIPSQLWFTLFKLDELLMRLRKLFQSTSAS